MALKDSMKKVKGTRDELRDDVEETRKAMRDLRPRPLRHLLESRMTEVRPLKRVRKRVADAMGREPLGEDST